MESLGLSEYLMMKYAGKETKSQYREIDNNGLIKELCNRLENEELNVVEQVKFDMEYLQYTDYTNDRMSNDYYIVTEYSTGKDVTRPVFVLRRIFDGEEIKCKIKQSNIFKTQPFGEFSVLRIEKFSYSFKRKPVNGQWVVTDEQECVLEEYEVIKSE